MYSYREWNSFTYFSLNALTVGACFGLYFGSWPLSIMLAFVGGITAWKNTQGYQGSILREADGGEAERPKWRVFHILHAIFTSPFLLLGSLLQLPRILFVPLKWMLRDMLGAPAARTIQELFYFCVLSATTILRNFIVFNRALSGALNSIAGAVSFTLYSLFTIPFTILTVGLSNLQVIYPIQNPRFQNFYRWIGSIAKTFEYAMLLSCYLPHEIILFCTANPVIAVMSFLSVAVGLGALYYEGYHFDGHMFIKHTSVVQPEENKEQIHPSWRERALLNTGVILRAFINTLPLWYLMDQLFPVLAIVTTCPALLWPIWALIVVKPMLTTLLWGIWQSEKKVAEASIVQENLAFSRMQPLNVLLGPETLAINPQHVSPAFAADPSESVAYARVSR